MFDSFERNIDYLRISITDLCNFRCIYCMPAEGVCKKERADILSLEEITEITRAAAELGIKKVRISGGEPLVRKGLVGLCENISAIEGIKDLAITTNGALLAPMAKDLKAAGVGRVNISIDTLDAIKFSRITRGGRLENTLEGIQTALDIGFSPVKLNVVLIGGFNVDEIDDFVRLTEDQPLDVRFIELMPIGEGAGLWEKSYVPNSVVLERIPELSPLKAERGGIARLYRLPGAMGRVGLINPISSHFCSECNRLRLTCEGALRPCLHSSVEIPLRGLHGDELKEAISGAIRIKPRRRGALDALHPSEAGRRMNQIGG